MRAVQLYGPTNFADVLEYTNSCAAAAQVSHARQQYFVLLVNTDGCILDMQRTVDTIVAGSDLPLSIIITGVGDANFSSMERLDVCRPAARCRCGTACGSSLSTSSSTSAPPG